MNRLSTVDRTGTAEIPTDLLAGLLMETARKPAEGQTEKLTLKIYCAMTATTLLTFATLTLGYQTLFAPHPFA